MVSGDIIQYVCGLFRDIKKFIFKRKKEKSAVFDNYYLHFSLQSMRKVCFTIRSEKLYHRADSLLFRKETLCYSCGKQLTGCWCKLLCYYSSTAYRPLYGSHTSHGLCREDCGPPSLSREGFFVTLKLCLTRWLAK